MGALMLSAGVMHFARPKFYESLIPESLGNARVWVYGSGAAELAAGGLLLNPRTSKLGAWAALLVLIGVFPANVKMALDVGAPKDVKSWGIWVRLPMQLPLIRWALRHTSKSEVSAASAVT